MHKYAESVYNIFQVLLNFLKYLEFLLQFVVVVILEIWATMHASLLVLQMAPPGGPLRLLFLLLVPSKGEEQNAQGKQ